MTPACPRARPNVYDLAKGQGVVGAQPVELLERFLDMVGEQVQGPASACQAVRRVAKTLRHEKAGFADST